MAPSIRCGLSFYDRRRHSTTSYLYQVTCITIVRNLISSLSIVFILLKTSIQFFSRNWICMASRHCLSRGDLLFLWLRWPSSYVHIMACLEQRRSSFHAAWASVVCHLSLSVPQPLFSSVYRGIHEVDSILGTFLFVSSFTYLCWFYHWSLTAKHLINNQWHLFPCQYCNSRTLVFRKHEMGCYGKGA